LALSQLRSTPVISLFISGHETDSETEVAADFFHVTTYTRNYQKDKKVKGLESGVESECESLTKTQTFVNR